MKTRNYQIGIIAGLFLVSIVLLLQLLDVKIHGPINGFALGISFGILIAETKSFLNRKKTEI